MTENPLPSSLYEGLLEKLVIVLELAQKNEGVVTPSAKQAILQATNDFKSALNRAKDLAANLPGGELRIEEQDEIIEMLETLKSRKRYVLSTSPPTLNALSLA
ncbi:hypothetical protein L208DRAFT_1390013 [Tricholoma matsutake]|nr:hypothetical protein L208DRAFT_1390013 [Tricholoma matsutake 945]